jgi:cholesterol oxidase
MEYIKHELDNKAPRSALDKEVIYGNNYGKRSLDKTYIADAMGTGNVSIYALQQVYHIEQLANGDYLLKVRGIDKELNVISDVSITCGALFIGAGSCGTSELLVRARDKGTLPKLNIEVGQGWGNNGNIMAARALHVWQPTGALQSTMPLMGINDWNNPINPVFCEITPLPMGFENWISMYLAITKTKERSYFKYDATTDKVTLQWTTAQSQYSINSAKQFLDKINHHEYTIYRYDLFENNTPFGNNFCYHPLGGCVLGKATDLYGRVKGYNKLYVTDSSLIPGLVGVNPFVTITAMAERNIEKVLTEDTL